MENKRKTNGAVSKAKTEDKRTARGRRVLIAAVAVASVVLGVLIGALVSIFTKRVDYLEDRLSRYVEISESVYRDAEIKITLPEPGAEAVSERAMLDLIGYKTSSDLSRKTFGRLGVGDVLDVKRITLNLTDGTKLYDSGEYELSGENVKKHTVGDEFLINGFKLSGVNYALEGSEIDCDLGKNTVSAYVYLPYDYKDLSLASKKVVLRIELYGFTNYDIPLLNDDFIENKLKISEKIKDFDGDKLSDKYINYIKEELRAEYEEQLDYLAEELIWERLTSGAEIKRLPKGDVRDRYSLYMEEIESAYDSVGNGVLFSDFACSYLGLAKGADYEEYLLSEAEAAVAEKLVFYSVLRAEEWLPSEAELAELYEESVSERLDVYLKYEVFCLPEHYSTVEEYNAEVASHRADLISRYGEDYFTDEAYFRFGMEKLKESFKITKE